MAIKVETSDHPAGLRENNEPTHVPGEPAFWLLLLGDMILFGLMFGVFVYYKYSSPEQLAVFQHGHATLNFYFGVANTTLLLASSWCVALAVSAAKSGSPERARRLAMAAFACGAMFVILKAFEYGEHVLNGYRLGTDIFQMFYYTYTGIHLVHVVIGLGVLAYISINCVSEEDDGTHARFAFLEGGTCYWHMVDVFWIIIFSLFYLAV